MSVLSANEIKCTRRYEVFVVVTSQSAILSGNAMNKDYVVKDKLEKLNGEIDEYEC